MTCPQKNDPPYYFCMWKKITLWLDNMEAHAGRSIPFISFIIVARKAQKYLINLLSDYLWQDYPIDFERNIIKKAPVKTII